MRNRLRVLRAEHRISQAELAERLGVARQTIHAIENGKFAPSLTLAFKIASLFGNDINEVFAPDAEDTVPALSAQVASPQASAPGGAGPARTRPLVYFGRPRSSENA